MVEVIPTGVPGGIIHVFEVLASVKWRGSVGEIRCKREDTPHERRRPSWMQAERYGSCSRAESWTAIEGSGIAASSSALSFRRHEGRVRRW